MRLQAIVIKNARRRKKEKIAQKTVRSMAQPDIFTGERFIEKYLDFGAIVVYNQRQINGGVI